MLMRRKIYDLLYLYKGHLIEVNLNLGGLITIDAVEDLFPLKLTFHKGMRFRIML